MLPGIFAFMFVSLVDGLHAGALPGERGSSYMLLSARYSYKIGCRFRALSVITEQPQVVICLSYGMKPSLRFRLAVMTLMIVVLAAIIVGAEHNVLAIV
jgi:hypothetical protein